MSYARPSSRRSTFGRAPRRGIWRIPFEAAKAKGPNAKKDQRSGQAGEVEEFLVLQGGCMAQKQDRTRRRGRPIEGDPVDVAGTATCAGAAAVATGAADFER